MDYDKLSPGFHNINQIKPCLDPSHNPPMGISVPFGMIYKHVCPRCGFSFILSNPNMIM